MEDRDTTGIAVGHIGSPVGPLTLAASGTGLRAVVFGTIDAEELAAHLGTRTVDAPRRLEAAEAQLGEYFRGERRDFHLDLDLDADTEFLRRVLTAMARIPYGHTLSYSELAREAGSPGAVRAVGSACRRNPLPLVIPCHRVVRSDGSVGNYAGGTEAKRWLLRLETDHA